MDLNALDWTVILIYMAGMIGLSFKFSRGQKSQEDYYLGGNATGPLPIALSTMATQSSTNSMLGIPAFVAFSTYGGMVWLQGEVALPFAMIILMVFLYPVFRSLNLISVYGYLEERFGLGTRTVASVLFLFMRALATGVTVYGVSLVLQVCLNIPFWAAVLLLGVITIIYDTLGGMKAVIWSDVIQLVIIFGAVLLASWLAVSMMGGIGETLSLFDSERMRGLDLKGHGLGDGQTFAFLPSFFGLIFLFVSYYGCDQTQAQRQLSTRSVEDTNRALFMGGLFRFPLVLSYCFLGICIGAYAMTDTGFIDTLPTTLETGEPNFNLAVPFFVSQHFPNGLIGLVVVGMFAAAMSSLDSTLNSLSAASMQDIVQKFFKADLSSKEQLIGSKLLTVFWGTVCLAFAFVVGGISDTIVESINKIGSVLYGPTLALFMLGVLTRRTNGPGAVTGFAAGFITNVLLWKFAPSVSWLWWNVIGFLIAYEVGRVASLFFPAPGKEKLEGTVHHFGSMRVKSGKKNWKLFYGILFLYGLGITGFLALLG